ncbi:MAG: ParA family protein [Gammaproteobacteria bacterium]|nr:MAG: ParA family protein [Gammaproteobacteria bacterium]
MKVIASYNIKGGVGKTAASVNLAFAAAASGRRTLLWDLDPQGASSYYFRVKPKVRGGGRALLGKGTELGRAIKASDWPRLDLIPADFSFRHLDLVLQEAKRPGKRLRKALAPLASEYDLVLLDCPPSVSLLSEGVMSVADRLLVPVIPTSLSLRAYRQLHRLCRDLELPEGLLAPFFSMVDRRRKLHREVAAQFSGRHRELLRSYIPYASVVEQMGPRRAPLLAFAPASEAGRAFRQLWEEVAARCEI